MPDNTEEIKLKTGETTTINLKGLATAGYQWNYTIDGNKNLVTISKDYALTDNVNRKPVGASADEVFTITAVKPGTVNVYFFQSRSWEKNANPKNKKRIHIIIE